MTIQEHIDAMRQRCEKATPGEWEQIERDVTHQDPRYSKPSSLLVITADETAAVYREPDATFIAHARTDLPRLLDALEIAVKDLEAAELVGWTGAQETLAQMTAALDGTKGAE